MCLPFDSKISLSQVYSQCLDVIMLWRSLGGVFSLVCYSSLRGHAHEAWQRERA